MFLAIDIGNTITALGIFDGEKLVNRWRIATESRRTREEYSIIIDGLFRLEPVVAREHVSSCLLASVVPHLTHSFSSSIKSICPTIAIKVLDSSLNIGMKNLYENPREVGADRLANAVGGKRLYGFPLIIADFGTATTLDIVNKDGDYLGGIILPGLEMSADALFTKTAQLPRIPISLPEKIIGTTTVKSIQSGICFGSISSVDSLIDRIWKELGYTTKVVGTGGYVEMLSSVSRNISAIEPYLTLYGLKFIWDMNYKE